MLSSIILLSALLAPCSAQIPDLLPVKAAKTGAELAQAAEAASSQEGPVQAGPQDLRGAIRRALAIHDSMRSDLLVNGVRVSAAEVDRQVLYRVGQVQIRQKLIEMIVDDQMAVLIEEGKKKKSDFAVFEQAVTDRIAKSIKEYASKNPGKDFWAELEKSNTSKEEFRTMIRSTLLFDKIFFPGIPKNWPEITKEAIMASGGEQGTAFFERLEESVKEGQKVPDLFLYICRQWVVKKMMEWSEVKYASDGLAKDACLSINGKHWKTKDAMIALAQKITAVDRESALLEIVLQAALKGALQKAGSYLDDQQFKVEFQKYREPYDKTPFTVEVMATMFKGYPSFETYKARWRLERSYENLISKEINDDSLEEHAKVAKAFLSDGRVSVNLLRLPAFDDSKGRWISQGFAKAEALADKIMEDIVAKKISFTEAMARYGKWPALAEEQGFYVSKSLNELRLPLKESDYTDFIEGYSVAEELFYRGKVDHVVGPFRGRDGYYICYIVDRIPAGAPMDLTDKNSRDLVKQDYLSHRFLRWANEVASKTKVHLAN